MAIIAFDVVYRYFLVKIITCCFAGDTNGWNGGKCLRCCLRHL